MSLVKTPKEIESLARGGKILAEILQTVAAAVRPGIATLELEKLARAEMKKAGVKPAFEGYRVGGTSPPYPAVLCSSVDHEIVHAIPRPDRILQAGQILGLDCGIIYEGLYTDAAVTVPVGKVSRNKLELIEATREALQQGIAQATAGNHLGDIAAAIQKVAQRGGYGIVRDLIGHGVGHALHEKPDVPNYGVPGTLDLLQIGMVFAIEPMFTLGDYHIKILDDGWTIVTADGSDAAHFEHTVAITGTGPRVLTR